MSSSEVRMRLLGPFTQILTMNRAPEAGAFSDEVLEIIEDGGLLLVPSFDAPAGGERAGVGRSGFAPAGSGQASGGAIDGAWLIHAVGSYRELARAYPRAEREDAPFSPSVLTPGLVDAHTHMCWTGHRGADFAARLAGESYREIASRGGGIMCTVAAVRRTDRRSLALELCGRARTHLQRGVCTAEVKSGYGLSDADEMKMLEIIADPAGAAGLQQTGPLPRLVGTFLGAHLNPPDSGMNNGDYLHHLADLLLPAIKERQLSHRVDIFVEQGAFSSDEARSYLLQAKKLGFALTVHADQFSTGGADLGIELGAASVDHLEHSTAATIASLASSSTAGVALPGASLGLGETLAPGRSLLDLGGRLVIASDWNPGSAPGGNLLFQAAVYAAGQKIRMGETWAAISFRAASALGLEDRGRISPGMMADLLLFPTHDWREILASMGNLLPEAIWLGGHRVVP